MSIALHEKLVSYDDSSKVSASSSFPPLILGSSLALSVISGFAIFAARSAGSIQLNQSEINLLATVGATICFTSLPLMVAVYRRHEKLGLIGGSVVFMSMALLAGVLC